MFGQSQAEHQWLEQLVGTWSVETTCQAAADSPPQTVNGQLVCRSLGGCGSLWKEQHPIPTERPGPQL